MARWTEEQLKNYRGRRTGAPSVAAKPTDAKARYYALGRLPAGHMNRTEQAYADHLRDLQLAGEVLWYRFEGIKLKLADNTFFTVDFAVLSKSGVLQMHEVKGWWQAKGRIKIKVAADIYPFKFIGVMKSKDGWKIEEF